MMIGVRRGVNPLLRMAGDSLAPADVPSVEAICAAFPRNKFVCTMLARENQHALCVAARKFRNLHIFGCWWFLNNPSLIEEITRMRIEMLGLGVTPQHSDCRVMDQLGYKWNHSRPILGKVLAEKYSDLSDTGWHVTRAEIEEIRGVAVSRGTIDQLLEMEWIRLGRRRMTPGRPATFVVTEAFLDHFGLETARDLQGLRELRAAGLLDNRPLPGNIARPNDDDTEAEDTGQSELFEE
jgi:hypothetical protein